MLDTTQNVDITSELEKIDFPVAVQPILDQQTGKNLPIQMGQVVRRLDNNIPLGIVRSRYKPITHKDAFGRAIDSMKNGNIDFTDAQYKVNVYENGALAQMEITFPKHHTVIGTHDLYLKFVARNSYNGRWKYQSFFGWLNQVCFNTLVSGQKLAYSANRHTTNFDIDSATRKIENAIMAVTNETDQFKKWWDTEVEDNEVLHLFKKTLATMKISPAKKLAGKSETNERCLTSLMSLYDEEVKQLHGQGDYGRSNAKGSLWCVYQASTAWSTHLSDFDNKKTKKYMVQQKRQDQVRDMLDTTHWKRLEGSYVY